MRFYKKDYSKVFAEKYSSIQEREFFAFLPIKIGTETRWLEKVKVGGYYYLGYYTNAIHWKNIEFLN